MCETGLVLEEIRFMLKHVRKFAAEKTVPAPVSQFPGRSFIKPSPRGVVLIMSPWNYPFLLTFGPMVDALAAGNTVILKPSAYADQAAGRGLLLSQAGGGGHRRKDGEPVLAAGAF